MPSDPRILSNLATVWPVDIDNPESNCTITHEFRYVQHFKIMSIIMQRFVNYISWILIIVPIKLHPGKGMYLKYIKVLNHKNPI